jgi:hypothetical protein
LGVGGFGGENVKRSYIPCKRLGSRKEELEICFAYITHFGNFLIGLAFYLFCLLEFHFPG